MRHIEGAYFIGSYIDDFGRANKHAVIAPPKFDVFRASVQFQTLSNGVEEPEELEITVYNKDGENFKMRYYSEPEWRWGNVPEGGYRPVGESHQIEFDVK
jgi:hypothetical protein